MTDNPSGEDGASTEALPVREAGRFVKGQSGNPAGRPPNSRNKLSNLRKELELAVIDAIGTDRLKRIIDKVAKQAEEGNIRAAKLLLDKVVPNASNADEGDNSGRTIVFRVENATVYAAQQTIEHAKQSDAIDVTVTDVTPINTQQESTK